MKQHKIKKAEEIIDYINYYFGVNCLEPTNEEITRIPRQIAMFYIRKHLKLGFYEIGKLFPSNKTKTGYKNHSTVMNACSRVYGYFQVDKEYIELNKILDEKCTNISKFTPLELEKYEEVKSIQNKLLTLSIEEIKEFKNYINGK